MSLGHDLKKTRSLMYKKVSVYFILGHTLLDFGLISFQDHKCNTWYYNEVIEICDKK